ncbi:hypothetical protein [Candidatus Thiosymbion oneisti]|uniref:hypothetical protein n=1 Tax=Candidatus Thiosymbion oneisti TaxID=589554 RepID=UPI000AE3CDD9|nr:hypothetical protein [Candidatus Thiosymbion oneisti]
MRIKNVLILEEAMVDLEDGKCFYDEKEAGVGNYFWDSLLADLESLVIYAGIHSKRFGFQRMLAKRFPYAIYYEIKEETAYVVAILPMRRNPAWIKGQLKERNQQKIGRKGARLNSC